MVALGFAGAMAGFPQEARGKPRCARLKRAKRRWPRIWRRGRSYAAERSVTPPIAVPRCPATRRVPSNAGRSAATRRPASAPSAAACATSRPIRSRRPPKLPGVDGAGAGQGRRHAAAGEDELASINMIIGGSFGGRAFADSHRRPRPGADGRGHRLAVASRRPVVIVDVMPAGLRPASPARASRANLSFAVSGLHGDAPRLVLAPSSIARLRNDHPVGVGTGGEAGRRRRSCCQTMFLGQSPGDHRSAGRQRAARRALKAEANAADYKRYRNTESGRLADGGPRHAGRHLHRRTAGAHRGGGASSNSRDHQLQLDKRERKLARFDYGDAWADIDGDATRR